MAEKTIEQLKAELEKVTAENTDLKTQLSQAGEVVTEMQGKIEENAKALKSVNAYPTVKVDKKEYEIRVPGTVRFKGKMYSAEDIKSNKEIAEKLVKIKASFMVAVEKD